jgi:hypothetical protein
MLRIRNTGYKICILLLIFDLLWLNWQVYVDLAVDENGLWAIMAMRENNNTLILKVRYLVQSSVLSVFSSPLSSVTVKFPGSLNFVWISEYIWHIMCSLVPDIRVEQGTEMFLMLHCSRYPRGTGCRPLL